MNELFLIAALSVTGVSFQHSKTHEPMFTQADESFFRFLRECMPEPGHDDILFVHDPLDYEDLFYYMRKLLPGGFLFIENNDPAVYRIMKNHHYQRLPFLWRTYEIYRRPVRNMEASA